MLWPQTEWPDEADYRSPERDREPQPCSRGIGTRGPKHWKGNFHLVWHSFTKNRRPSYLCRLCSLSPYCLNRNNDADLIWNETVVVVATQGSASIPFAGLTALQAWLAATTQSYWSSRSQSTVPSKLVLLCATSPQLASCYLPPSLCFALREENLILLAMFGEQHCLGDQFTSSSLALTREGTPEGCGCRGSWEGPASLGHS